MRERKGEKEGKLREKEINTRWEGRDIVEKYEKEEGKKKKKDDRRQQEKRTKKKERNKNG